MENKQVKKCSTSYVIQEIQIKTACGTIKHVRMVKARMSTTSNAGKNVEQQEFLFIASGNTKCYSHFGREFVCFLCK
jgi:hypothetical protein